ncbi:hypothetical protein BU17DRAFT_63348 [Hysterangium stoloniferum]|nr:hypothetical protein BU17DRAFT_63348 [Hysterangium stoloniferum]
MTWLFLLSLSCCPFHLKLSLSTRHCWDIRDITVCTAVCANFTTILGHCDFNGPPSCTCTVSFVKAKIQCLLCKPNSSPLNLAGAKLLLDNDVARCHRAGIQISYSLLLDPAAAAIVRRVYRANSVLRTRQTVFLALQIIGGHIGIFLVLVLAVFSRRYCVFVVLSKAYRLYRGTSENTCLQPLGYVKENLCLAQAALTNGAQVMTASSTLSLVIRLWLDLRTALCGETKEPKKNQPIVVLTLPKKLLIAPYVLFLAFGLVVHFRGDLTIQGNFYCIALTVPSSVSGKLTPYSQSLQPVYGVTLIISLITVALEVSVSSSISSNFSVLADMMQAAIPLLGTIIFGTRSDIVGAVVLWRRNDAVKA